MIQFIFGGTGSGKTHIARSFFTSSPNAIFIAPEQNLFETQKYLLKTLGAGQSAQCKVFSFLGLIELVMSVRADRNNDKSIVFPVLKGRMLDSTERFLFTAMAVRQVAGDLRVYTDTVDRPDFITLLADTLTTFKQCRITPSKLQHTAGRFSDRLLGAKLLDLAKLFSAFEEKLFEEEILDPKDTLTLLADTFEHERIFEGHTVVIDGFHTFTPQELAVLTRVFEQAEQVYVTIPAPFEDDYKTDVGLFSPVWRNYQQLLQLAKQTGRTILSPVKLSENYSTDSAALLMLERNILRNGKKEKLEDDTNAIRLFEATTPYGEVSHVAAEILRIVREEEVPFRDIAVTARSMSDYGDIIDDEFQRQGIPFYRKRSDNICKKSLPAFVLAALDCITHDFRTEDILRYLKTGLCGISMEDIALLETYTYTWRISGSEWLSDWDKNPRGYGVDITDNDQDELDVLNELRKEIITPLCTLGKSLDNVSGKSVAEGIYHHLIEVGANVHLKHLADKLAEKGFTREADEQTALWDIIMKLLDTLAPFPELKDYAGLIRLALEGAKTDSAVLGFDMVSVTAGEESFQSAKRIVFVMGGNAEQLPSSVKNSGFFSDYELTELKEVGLTLTGGIAEAACYERFLAYRMLTYASSRLYLSWSRISCDGGELLPSPLIPEIQKIFPSVKAKGESLIVPISEVQSKEAAWSLLAERWSDDTPFSISLKEYFSENPEYTERIDRIDKAVNRNLKFGDSENAVTLFGKHLHLTASKTETFYSCPFQFFCRHGMKVYPRVRGDLGAMDYGTIFHRVMEGVLRQNEGTGIVDLTREEIGLQIDEYIKEERPANNAERRMLSHLAYTAEELLARIADDFRQGSFVPEEYEAIINGYSLPLPEGGTLNISGVADRVDICRGKDEAYLRIIDYKTGMKTYSVNNLAYGLDTQPLIYLFALCNNKRRYKNAVPAGGFYLSTASLKDEKKSLMSGIFLREAEPSLAMDKDASKKFIPLSLDKQGNLKYPSEAFSRQEMNALFDYINELLTNMGIALHTGEIEPYPLIGEINSCKWCDYHSVCTREKTDTSREAKKLTSDELHALLFSQD